MPAWLEAMALAEIAYAYSSENNLTKALEASGLILERFSDHRDNVVLLQVARALVTNSYAHCKSSNYGLAIQACEEVERRFGKYIDPDMQERVAAAMANKGVSLGMQGMLQEAHHILEEVERRFGEAKKPGILEQVASAMVNKGVVCGQQGRYAEEISDYEEVEQRVGKAKQTAILEYVAMATVYKGVVLGQQGRQEEELQAYEKVERRFGKAKKTGILEQVAKAMVYKGWKLSEANQWSDAVRVFEKVATRFCDSANPSLLKWFFEAQLRRSLALLEVKNEDKAHELFDDTQKRILSKSGTISSIFGLYTMVARRFAHKTPQKDAAKRKKQKKLDLEITSSNPESHLEMILSHVLEEIDSAKQAEYFKNMEESQQKTDRFITQDAHFTDKISFMLILREWNSYTPMIPSSDESDRGGGYYIRHAGQGIVIDPGYDFIANFHRAGGRLNGIDHIIVTHAHDDHTAELEALLMLLQRRRNNKALPNKRVNLYLSAGVQRKFAGQLDLRDLKYGGVYTLCPSTNQRIPLNDKTVLTVLPAFHDDVITRNSAVGLGFEFETENGKRRVVFTGDSGLYPRKLTADGEEQHYDEDGKNPMLEATPGRALFDTYPEELRNCPHLVVAHIGSIKQQEFAGEHIPAPSEVGRRFYPNHLGLLGTLMLLHALHPDAAVISEFGAELKGFHIELVQKLGKALNKFQEKSAATKKNSFVVAGDLTTAYDITNHRFLCHTKNDENLFKFSDIDKLTCRSANDYIYKLRWEEEIEVSKKDGTRRSYLFTKGTSADSDNLNSKNYAKHFFGRRLPYQINPVNKPEEL